MATSAINFQGNLTLNSDLTIGEVEFQFRPPSNIAGKLCYVDTKAFGLRWDETYTTPQVYDTFLLRSSWAQPQSVSIETNSEGPFRVETTLGAAANVTTATSLNEYTSISGTLTALSNTITNINPTGVTVGMKVLASSSIPGETYVTAVDATGLTVTLSNSALFSGTTTIYFYGNQLSLTAVTGSVANIETGYIVTGDDMDQSVVTAVNGSVITINNYVEGDVANVSVYPNYVTVASATGIKSGMTLSSTTTATASALSTTGVVSYISGTKVYMTGYVNTTIASGGGVYFSYPVTEFTQRMSTPLAYLNYSSMTSAGGPILAFIPDGPHTVKFSVARMDKNVIGLSTSDISIGILLGIVAANSRQPPIGV